MAKLQEMMSMYIVLVMLGVGLYMAFVRYKAFKQVNHLEREAQFSKVVGYIYIVLGICSAIFLVIS